MENYKATLAKVKEQGGEILYGGNVLDRPGNFVEPTIVTHVTPDMDIWRDETFGPVAVVVPNGASYAHDLAPLWRTRAALVYDLRNRGASDAETDEAEETPA